jgi:hypothetical protein
MVVWFLSANTETEKVDKAMFTVSNLEEVDEVVLKSRSKEVKLHFNGTQWLVNGEHRADQQMIEVLFATLKQAEPKRPVASAKNDSISNKLLTDGVEINLFEQGKLMKHFYAGGNLSKSQGYFLDPDTRTSYVMQIPGYRVYVSGVFELDESGFRDKYVFGFNWHNFKGLSAKFPANAKDNFDVSMGKGFFTIEGVSKIDTARLNTFLDNVSLLVVDHYGPSIMADSLKKLTPSMTISIQDVANRNYELAVYGGIGGEFSGLVNDDAVFFDPRRIQPILVPKSFFLKR